MMLQSIFRTFAFGLVAASGLALGSGQAAAADMPGAAPLYKAPVVAPLFNWSGFYTGIHGGYTWSKSTGPGAAGVEKEGPFGGAQIGANYQAPASPVVFGWEADVSYGDIDDSIYLPLIPGVFEYAATSESGLFGSVRARLGYAVDRSLWYVHGGWVWGENTVHARDTISGWRGSDSQWHHGWTVGAGAEWALTEAWSAKLEYAYSEFGEETYFADETNPSEAGSRSHTVRVGLNYRWGAGKAPVRVSY
jgi:outer membrane immunogenic protein